MSEEIGLKAYYKHKESNKDIKGKESLSDYQKTTKESNVDEELANRILNM